MLFLLLWWKPEWVFPFEDLYFSEEHSSKASQALFELGHQFDTCSQEDSTAVELSTAAEMQADAFEKQEESDFVEPSKSSLPWKTTKLVPKG